MLKIALIPEEVRGARQLAWWDGNGAARVIAIEGGAVLIERAAGGSLAAMSSGGRDEEATSIVSSVAARLHRAPPPSALELVPLDNWFAPLLEGTAKGDDFAMAAGNARQLLETKDAEVSLHGDLHHHNLLDFGDGDWRAIDPKGLRGERAFDFVHLLRNPDLAVSSAPGRLEARVAQIAAEAGISRSRLLGWAAAFSALSAVWTIEDEDCPEGDIALLRRCRALLSVAGAP